MNIENNFIQKKVENGAEEKKRKRIVLVDGTVAK